MTETHGGHNPKLASQKVIGFHEMLQHELRGRELPSDEMRRVTERTWHAFLKHGWPRT
jgi:hypothetical protein